MSALPYMPLYVADYLADTSHLSAIENGAYLLLIMNYWQRGAAIPCGDSQLARICRLSLKEWQSVKPELLVFFDEQDGIWIHHRIENELSKVREKSVKASNAGKASAQRKVNRRSTDVQHTFNHTDTDTDTDTELKKVSGASRPDKRGCRLRVDFEPDETCQRLFLELNLESSDWPKALSNFKDYWGGVPGAKGLKLDWQGTFRNSLRKFAEFKPRSKPTGNHYEKPKSNADNIATVVDAIDGELARVQAEIDRQEAGSGSGSAPLRLVS